jgi:hypothetical protein
MKTPIRILNVFAFATWLAFVVLISGWVYAAFFYERPSWTSFLGAFLWSGNFLFIFVAAGLFILILKSKIRFALNVIFSTILLLFMSGFFLRFYHPGFYHLHAMDSIFSDDLEKARALVARHQDLKLDSLFFLAVSRGQPEIAQIFLNAGANINRPAGGGETPLHSAVVGLRNPWVSTGRYEQTVKFLLHNGAIASVKNDKGQTPRDALAAFVGASDALEKFDSMQGLSR